MSGHTNHEMQPIALWLHEGMNDDLARHVVGGRLGPEEQDQDGRKQRCGYASSFRQEAVHRFPLIRSSTPSLGR